MYEENQSFVPESFMSLYLDKGRVKPRLTRIDLSARYELCEDMANMLIDTASSQQFQLGITEDDALERCWRGLLMTTATASPEESFWVVCRLAELLSWPIPQSLWSIDLPHDTASFEFPNQK
jgi:hypothetical protein